MVAWPLSLGIRPKPALTFLKRFAYSATAVFLAYLATQEAAVAGDKTVPVALQLLWTHQAIFGGYYVADRQGFYAAEGLNVRFRESAPDADLLSPVLDGAAQFGIAGAAELLIARERGKPVRAIATIFRRSPVVYVSKASLGITRPDDFRGRTIRVVTDPANFFAMMSHAGLARTDYRMVSLPSDPKLFAADAADVWLIYINGFAVTLERMGQKLNYIYPDDYGVHFYADTLFTTDNVIATQPDLVLRFLRASLKGWTGAVEDPALVGPFVRSYDPQADADLETQKMRATQALVNTGEDHIGWMREERWAQMAKVLKEQGALSGSLAVDDVFTMAFLRKIYEAGAAIQ